MMTPATVIFALPAPPAPTPDTERASHQVSAGAGPSAARAAGRSRPQPADEDGVRYAAMLTARGNTSRPVPSRPGRTGGDRRRTGSGGWPPVLGREKVPPNELGAGSFAARHARLGAKTALTVGKGP
jgi:hypothetical protein